jgi:hypothetical protein
MNLYVLDTDTLQLYQDDNPKVVGRVRAVAAGASKRDKGTAG